MQTTRVGTVELPELPDGWEVAVDTEGAGLYGDGDPIPASGRPAQPEGRISVVSISFRQPMDDGTPGEIVDYAWPFDQGPVLGKPGKPIKNPDTGVCTFEPIDQAMQDKILAAMSKVLGYPVTVEMACPNLPVDDYVRLIQWLDRRDTLTMHNSIHDMPVFRYGLRAGAGGNEDVPEGYAAWDPDSEPGQWELGQPQELHMMEPSLKPLKKSTRRRSIHCTLVTQKQLIDPLFPAGLKPTGTRLWGEEEGTEAAELAQELAKLGVGMTKRYDLLPWCGAMGRYAAKDTNLTLRLSEYQMSAAEEGAVLPKFWPLYQAEMELRTTLYRMERRGVYYDAELSMQEGEKLRQLNKELTATLPFDPSKPSQAKRFYYGPICSRAVGIKGCPASCPECGGKNGLGLEPLERTPATKAPKLDITELRKLVEEERPYAKEYMEWTKRRNSDSKWYTGWAARTGRDGRIRTRYQQCKKDRERPGQDEGGAKSGRLAVSRWQCQAIPHGRLIPEGAVPVRKLVGAAPGKTLYEHDLATGELRVVTVVANSTKMWDALDAGLDLHGMNTTAVFGIEPDHPDFKDMRNGAKRMTFGILYGGGAFEIKSQVEAATGKKMSMPQIKEAIDMFFKTYPEFRKMGRDAENKVSRWKGGCGYLTMLDGWRRWYAPDEKTNSAVNQVIQGNLARAMIYWMNEVERQLPDVLLLQIHDSLVTEHDDTEQGYKEALQVSEIGQRVFGRYFGVRGRSMDFGIEPERWDKKS